MISNLILLKISPLVKYAGCEKTGTDQLGKLKQNQILLTNLITKRIVRTLAPKENMCFDGRA